MFKGLVNILPGYIYPDNQAFLHRASRQLHADAKSPPRRKLKHSTSPANINIDAMEPTTHPDQAISLKTAFWYWLKLGFISFGGPAGQIAMMHAELVDQRRWISERRFTRAQLLHAAAGPEATQLAVYIGWLMHRTIGGLMAGILFILPSLFILIGLSWAYMVFGKHHIVSGVLYGIKPAIVAIVLAAAWRIGSRPAHAFPERDCRLRFHCHHCA
jgi:chromate transport protein ChrA